MLDARLRAAYAPLVDRVAARLVAAGVTPMQLTVGGWGIGVAACVAAGLGWWTAALVLWLGNRLLDGLDGAVARAGDPTEHGGFLDIVADFSIYAGFLVGVAVSVPSARLGVIVLLTTYYVSGAAFLGLSWLVERRRNRVGDERSLNFVGGLAEGAETIVAYALIALLPAHATTIVWVFAAAVAVTAVQRTVVGYRLLTASPPADPALTGTSTVNTSH